MANYSKQREIILGVLKDAYDHPTADEVYSRAREIKQDISRGTVYRNLDSLVESNEIIKISNNGNADRFDCPKSEHHHLICLKCGKVTDINLDINMRSIQKAIKKQVEVGNISPILTISYVCNDCLK